jgi:YidC/Oxa1 family membrane protein insertase
VNLNWLYTAVSWIMLRWHDLWSAILGDGTFLGTNWAWILSIIFLVITVRILLFPLFVKQIKTQRAMQALQPKIKELQEKHRGDRETLQRELMELYRREKANPLMGCLPMFLQVPVFISLFWILGRRLDPARVDAVNSGFPREKSNIELYGWTFDQYASATHATLFDAPIAAVFFQGGWFDRELPPGTSMLAVRLVAGVLTLIMTLTTFLTTRQMMRRTGWSTDPTQLMVQRLMVYGLPAMLLFSGLFFPISVILYWVVNNLFSLGQQQWVLRKYPPPATAMAGGGANGARPAGRRAQPSPGKAGATDGRGGDRPRVDGRLLAPKPGAKPVRNVPPKRKPSSANVPPKRGGSGQRKG